MSPECLIHNCLSGTAYSKFKCRCKVCKKEHKRHYDANRSELLSGMREYNLVHKDSIIKYKHQHYILNIDKYKDRRIKDYNISVKEYNALVQQQKGKCKICGLKPKNKRRLSIDHDHHTNKVRGLLCGPCNSAIGLFKDDIKNLVIAIQYLGGYNE